MQTTIESVPSAQGYVVDEHVRWGGDQAGVRGDLPRPVGRVRVRITPSQFCPLNLPIHGAGLLQHGSPIEVVLYSDELESLRAQCWNDGEDERVRAATEHFEAAIWTGVENDATGSVAACLVAAGHDDLARLSVDELRALLASGDERVRAAHKQAREVTPYSVPASYQKLHGARYNKDSFGNTWLAKPGHELKPIASITTIELLSPPQSNAQRVGSEVNNAMANAFGTGIAAALAPIVEQLQAGNVAMLEAVTKLAQKAKQ